METPYRRPLDHHRNRVLVILSLLLTLLPYVAEAAEPRRKNHGLIGYGIVMFDPPCAYGCKDTIRSSPLRCSDQHAGDHGGHHGLVATSSECYATDDVFLQTAAYCLSTKCTDIPAWKLEYFWSRDLVGRSDVVPKPKWTYQETLARIESPPNVTFTSGDPLNQTSLVPYEAWNSNFVTNRDFARSERNHSKYGLVVLLTTFLGPVGLSALLRFAPVPPHVVSKISAYLVQPALFRGRHRRPLPWNIGILPTTGQALFITYIILINIILSGVGLYYGRPNAWYPDHEDRGIRGLVANRVGLLALANMPVAFLFAGRNNFLLWLTDWSHSTFLLMHRWIAYIVIIQAALHSVLWLDVYVKMGTHSQEIRLPYWYWGIIATVGVCFMLPLSILPLRQRLYEFFLAWHVVLAILVLLGCYLHIVKLYANMWGYETWLYPAIAVWGFDRLVRLLRLARNGVRTAVVTVIDEDCVRVDVPGVAADGHAYLYFPTLTWRVWENHPFSVASMMVPRPIPEQSSSSGQLPSDTAEKRPMGIEEASYDTERGSTTTVPSLGLTFFLRGQAGLTALLAARKSLPVLIESSYGPHPDLSRFPSVVCIAGGVGITSVLPFLRRHFGGRAALFWGVRTPALVAAVEPYLAGVDKEVRVGERLALGEILEREIGPKGSSAAVVVSGPPGMADDVRELVTRIQRRAGKRDIQLVEDSFSW